MFVTSLLLFQSGPTPPKCSVIFFLKFSFHDLQPTDLSEGLIKYPFAHPTQFHLRPVSYAKVTFRSSLTSLLECPSFRGSLCNIILAWSLVTVSFALCQVWQVICLRNFCQDPPTPWVYSFCCQQGPKAGCWSPYWSSNAPISLTMTSSLGTSCCCTTSSSFLDWYPDLGCPFCSTFLEWQSPKHQFSPAGSPSWPSSFHDGQPS